MERLEFLLQINMVKFSIKTQGHSLLKEILYSTVTSLLFNSAIFLMGTIISLNYVIKSNFLPVYYGAIVGFLAIYATIIAISTNLSQEFPLKISLKYIVYSRLSLSYLFIIGLNLLSIHILFLNSLSGNFENSILMLSTAVLFLLTIIFILFFMNKFKLDLHIRSFFKDMVSKYNGDFSYPKLISKERYDIEETENTFLIKKDFKSLEERIDTKDTEVKEGTNITLSSTDTSKMKISPNKIYMYLGKGKLQIKNWDFLNKLDVPFSLEIKKYENEDDLLGFQVLCEYLPKEDKIDTEKRLKNIIKSNICYKDFPKEEFKEVFDKLSKNGTEDKLILLIKKYIANEDNLQEKRFLFSEFEEFFKIAKISKIHNIDEEKILEIEIKNLYEQKNLFFKSPYIIARLQKRLKSILVQAFRKINYFSPRLEISGLYIKEFLDIRYVDDFKSSTDINWIRQYEYLIKNTIDNIFTLCRFIIELDIREDLKKKYLIEQISHLNKTLDNFDNLNKTDLFNGYYDLNSNVSKKELADNKIKRVEKQKEYLKERQSELFYLILYNIDKNILSKNFFEIALKIYKLKDFEKRYYQYRLYDELDWLNYNGFSGGVQTIAPFNFNRYRLLISFYKYLDNAEIDINKFEKENFLDTSFENELNNLDESFIRKYFDFDKKKLSSFKKEVSKSIKDIKKSLVDKESEYIIKTPLKDEYINQFKEDCKKSWEKIQEEISEFVKIKIVEGGKNKKEVFHQYRTFPREWFLDSFHKNVSLSRHNGGDFGNDQGRSKYNKILEDINNSFNKKKDKEIVLKDTISDLSKIVKKNKEYYLFYNSKLEIYKIPNLDYNRTRFETANLKLNDSVIHFCYANIPQSILIERNSFVLKQYSQGFDNINEQLVVQVEDLTDKDVREIMNKNKRYKNKDEVKQMVKIRVAEKFELERKAGTSIVRLKI